MKTHKRMALNRKKSNNISKTIGYSVLISNNNIKLANFESGYYTDCSICCICGLQLNDECFLAQSGGLVPPCLSCPK